MVEAKRSRVSGIDRAFQVLDFLTEKGEASTAYDIAKAVGAPTSTIYEIIDTLCAKGILQRRGDRGQVFLGAKLHFYGLGYVKDTNQAAVFQRAMEDLARDTGETVQICGRDDDKMVVLMMEEGSGHFHVSSRVGSRVPWNWTASGRLLVAGLPDAQRADLCARAVPSPTGRAEIDPAKLADSCKSAWEQGLSVQVSESDYAVACIAAPIRNDQGECVATISLVVPDSRASDPAHDFTNKARVAAKQIEVALGWRRPSAGSLAAE
ncbi:IclR family transcriptional regulator [Lacibacterium aquatile]|uniref:IclR family transcriptional regulator n=1 Tax=Lacibacterium aquatile TaxID=1168082 RepID=A0ABW5DXP7_9PROT